MRLRPIAEPTFEPPPRLSWPIERRLSGRAVTVWEASCDHGRPPAAAAFARSELALFCAASSLGLVATADGAAVSSVGAAVAAAFGLSCGSITAASPPLGARLGRAFAELCGTGRPVSFEARFAGPSTGALMLTRGVLLPLLDEAGSLTQSLAIMTWKEGLGDVANRRLRGEIDDATTAARKSSGHRSPGSLYAVFARQTCPSAAADA